MVSGVACYDYGIADLQHFDDRLSDSGPTLKRWDRRTFDIRRSDVNLKFERDQALQTHAPTNSCLDQESSQITFPIYSGNVRSVEDMEIQLVPCCISCLVIKVATPAPEVLDGMEKVLYR